MAGHGVLFCLHYYSKCTLESSSFQGSVLMIGRHRAPRAACHFLYTNTRMIWYLKGEVNMTSKLNSLRSRGSTLAMNYSLGLLL